MSAITWADVAALAPEMADVPEAAQIAILNYVNASTTFRLAHWGGEDSADLHLGRCYLAAHLAVTADRGSAGAVTAETAGGLSRSYAVTGEGFNSSAYGQEFKRLARRASGGPAVL